MLVRTVLAGLVVVLFTLIFIPLLLLCFIFRVRRPLFGVARFALRLTALAAGLKVEVSGLEHIDRKRVYVFMSNHLSFIDGPLLFLLIPQPVRVILKKQLFRIPVIGLGMKYLGFVPVDRRGIKQGRRAIERAAGLIRRKRYSFLIFPEGTRSRDGRLQPFKRGGFFLAAEAGAPILPLSVEGTFALMPRGSFFIRGGKIRVRFHPALPVGQAHDGSLTETMARTRAAIVSGLSEEE
ncbi:MAG TPA: lysophospholipid acyltransferase family protein [Acidobacteriota bacterium]